MFVPLSLRSLLFLAWLTTAVAAQNASSSVNELSIPGLPAKAPPAAVVDTVNLFRGHPELRAQLDDELARLAAEDGVDLWLVTTSFQTRQSPAEEAAEIVGAWSGDRPAIVLIYIRGNHSSGIAANGSLQEIVPSFELADALPASANSDSGVDSVSDPDTKARDTSLVETTHGIADLIRRYTNDKSQARDTGTARTDATPASHRHAKSLLLIAVLVLAGLIVWFTARTTRT